MERAGWPERFPLAQSPMARVRLSSLAGVTAEDSGVSRGAASPSVTADDTLSAMRKEGHVQWDIHFRCCRDAR